ncbi:MAG: glycosyltransferase, partial [Ignavibacteriaceae bacterium]
MKKICHIVNLIDGKADGVFNHLMMIFRNYDRTQFEHFIIFQGGEFVEDKLSSINIRYYVVESLKSKFSLKSFKEIRLIIKDENPAILHTHLIKSYIIAGIINVIYNRRFIFNFHGSFIQNDYNNWIEKLLYLIAHR